MSSIERIVMHLDMDAFYAAVEVRDRPELAGKPLIIGHEGRRGVVATCSYEARRFGVHSAQPSVIARRLCPQAIWVSGRMNRYVEVSRAIRDMLDDFSPLVEPISIDEAFVDLTGISLDMAQAQQTAARLKARVQAEQRLCGSVGLAPNKFLAKIASDMDKPDGLVVLTHSQLAERFWPLPIERLWGVGPKTAERLKRGGVRTVGDILKIDRALLTTLVSDGSADHLRRLARGEDDRPVQPNRKAKSISEERTYGQDLTRPEEIDRALLARADGVARQLRRGGWLGRTVQLKVRTGNFTTWTRSHTLRLPTDLAEPIVAAARLMLREKIRLAGQGVRLLGVGMSGLERPGTGQSRLFVDDDEERTRRITDAADAVRDRLGERSVTRARLLPRRRETDQRR